MTSRARQLIKLLNRLIKQEHLYNEDQLIQMKRQLRMIKEELSELEVHTSKGFGKK
jgi:t-SNARE complex subunit (syntaxin)